MNRQCRFDTYNATFMRRLYPSLDTLVRKELIKSELDQQTNYYTVTRRGNREITARTEWEQQYINESVAE
jgi:DNA-binding PadR family transcriptional regulator